MKTRTCRFFTLFLHVIPAGHQHKGIIAKQRHDAVCVQPIFRLVGLIIITVHHNDIGFDKVIITPAVVLVFGTYMIEAHSLHHINNICDFQLIRIDHIRLVFDHTIMKKDIEFHPM